MLNIKEEDKILKKYGTDISSNLKYLLDIYSMSILELSKKSNVAYGAVYKLVNKAASPNLDTLVKISKVFNLNVSQLIGEFPLTTNTAQNFETMIPVIEWTEVTKFLDNHFQGLENQTIKPAALSPNSFIEDTTFILTATEATEPAFIKGTALVFNRINQPLKIYDNKFVLAVINNNNLPALKKLFIDKNKVILQPINSTMPNHILQPNDSVIAYLVQARIDV